MGTADFHRVRAEGLAARSSNRIDNNGEGDALLAIFHLLNERLPERPMQVIGTPRPPVEDKPQPMEQMTFSCSSGQGDQMVVTPIRDGGGFEFYMQYGRRQEPMFVQLTEEDALSLARAIIASV